MFLRFHGPAFQWVDSVHGFEGMWETWGELGSCQGFDLPEDQEAEGGSKALGWGGWSSLAWGMEDPVTHRQRRDGAQVGERWTEPAVEHPEG